MELGGKGGISCPIGGGGGTGRGRLMIWQEKNVEKRTIFSRFIDLLPLAV